MQDRQRTGIGARLVRTLRWQEQNERQVWLVAAGNGLVGGLIVAAFASRALGWILAALVTLPLMTVFVTLLGLGRRYRLHKRQAAQVTVHWGDRR